MADATVNLKLTAVEYRFLRSELEIHVEALHRMVNHRGKSVVEAPTSAQRSNARQREASLREMMKGI